jgi:hypothetical protein
MENIESPSHMRLRIMIKHMGSLPHMRVRRMIGMSPHEEYGKSPSHEGEKNDGNVST